MLRLEVVVILKQEMYTSTDHKLRLYRERRRELFPNVSKFALLTTPLQIASSSSIPLFVHAGDFCARSEENAKYKLPVCSLFRFVKAVRRFPGKIIWQ
jgi:hypothetical protein